MEFPDDGNNRSAEQDGSPRPWEGYPSEHAYRESNAEPPEQMDGRFTYDTGTMYWYDSAAAAAPSPDTTLYQWSREGEYGAGYGAQPGYGSTETPPAWGAAEAPYGYGPQYPAAGENSGNAPHYAQNYALNYAPGSAPGRGSAAATAEPPWGVGADDPPAPGPAPGARPGPGRPRGKVDRRKPKGLARSGAVMAAGTLASRITGFLRSVIIAAAIGMSGLGDSYQVANTIPTMVYILVGGGALNAVFLPQLVQSMRNDDDGGEAYANRLITLVICGLGGITFLAVLGAPLLVRAMSTSLTSDPESARATVALARYCLPTIFFSGVFVVFGQILNARERFGAMMWTPVLNNIIIIFTFGCYIYVYGTFRSSGVSATTVDQHGIRLLGVGTLLGLVVQAGSMVPYLRSTGFRFRPRFDWRGHGLGKAAGLAKWTFLFVLANQAGLIVVTQLATAAGAHAERAGVQGAGINTYLNAQLIWGLPQAVITVSIITAILPRMARAAAEHDRQTVVHDLSYGLRTTAVAIVPAAFLFLALGRDIGVVLFGIGVGANGGAVMVGNMLMAFSLGLIPFSVQYVLLRVFYAFEDTRTPFLNTLWVAGSSALLSLLCYETLPARWAVVGMAACYGVSYAVGTVVAVRRLKRKLGSLDGSRIVKTYTRLILAGGVSAIAGYATSHVLHGFLGHGTGAAAAAGILGCLVLLGVFFSCARLLRVQEVTTLLGGLRGRFGG